MYDFFYSKYIALYNSLIGQGIFQVRILFYFSELIWNVNFNEYFYESVESCNLKGFEYFKISQRKNYIVIY